MAREISPDSKTKMTDKKKKAIVRESNLSTDQVKLAVPALFAYLEKNPKKDKQLFDENETFWLLMSLKKIPAPDKKPRLITVPHSFNDESEVCLFTKLPGKQVKEKLKEQGITNVTKVISLMKLRKEYKSFEDKRNLCSRYGTFLCDDRIYHLLPRVLGKAFFSRKKEPTPIRLTSANMKEVINKAIKKTKVRFGHGSCSAIKVGHSGQTQDEVIENIVSVAAEIAKKVPRGWRNIQTIHLKSSESVALPLYNSLPGVKNVAKSKKPPLKKKKEE